MNSEVTALESLILWRLASSGGGEWNPDIKPKLEAAHRKRLLDFGLIESAKLRREGKRVPTLFVSLSDKGWAFLGEKAEPSFPPRANGIETLSRLVSKLQHYLKVSDVSLAEVIRPAAPSPARDSPTLDRRIEEAYFGLSNGESNVRVRLADLRGALQDIPKEQLDAALLDLAGRGKAALYRLDMPWEIRESDRDAVLRTPSGEERHIIYFGGKQS